MNEKLFHRNFTLVVVGQIISLFGNTILRFALPLYLLDATGSSAVFGTVMAISLIPMILLSPVGGMIADRVNRRNIMVVLDFITSGLVILFGLTIARGSAVLLVGGILICFSAIQAMYQPAVQASIPVLSTQENLTRSNAVVNQVNALSSLLGPVLGGMLYGIWGLMPVVAVSAVSFLLSAVMEIFIQMPYKRPEKSGSLLKTVKGDLSESLRFILHGSSALLPTILVVSLFNLFLSSMLTIAGPILIKTILVLPAADQLYGIAQGAMAAGGLLGGILTGVFAKKLHMRRAHWILLTAALAITPIGIALFPGVPGLVTYGVIVICAFVFSMFGTMFNVMALTLVQRVTPDHLIGKVISYVLALCMCAQPIGQALYGLLFDGAAAWAPLIILGTVAVTSVVALCSRGTFRKLPE